MDIRGYFAAGGSIKSEENKKNTPADKDNDKRANEDGKLPPPKRKFLPSWKTDFPWVACRDGAMFCTVCEEKPNLSDSSLKVLASRKLVLASEIKVVTSHWASLQKS